MPLQTVKKGEPLTGGFTAVANGLLVDLKTKHKITCPGEQARPACTLSSRTAAALRLAAWAVPWELRVPSSLKSPRPPAIGRSRVARAHTLPRLRCLPADGGYSVVYEVRGIVPARRPDTGERGSCSGCTRDGLPCL